MSTVLIPRLNANEDELLLASLLVSLGDDVEIGQELAILESTKAVQSVYAEISGQVSNIFSSEGNMVAVGSVLIHIGENENFEPEFIEPSLKDEKKHETAGKRLLKREKEKTTIPDIIKRPIILKPAQELDWVIEAQALLPDLENVKRTWNVSNFPNALIEDDVILSASSLYIEEGAIIEKGVTIDVENAVIRSGSKIGANTVVQTKYFILSKGAVLGKEVKIDLAGGAFPDSSLFVGPLSLIGGQAMINPCREVILERESAISPSANLFTHSFWQSILEGYSTNFKPIRIQEKAWVGSGCQILPGVTVGRGAILMSNSTAIDDIPPESFSGGVPATILKHPIVKELTLEQQRERILNSFNDWAKQLNDLGCTSSVKDELLHTKLPDGSLQTVSVNISDNNLLLVLSNGGQFNLTLNTFSGENNRFTDELRNLLRRRGIRILPDSWNFGFRGPFNS